MKKLISVLAISALMFGATSIGAFAYQGDTCPNNGDCIQENCPNDGNCQNYKQTSKGSGQKKGGNGTGQGKRAKMVQRTRMNCNR